MASSKERARSTVHAMFPSLVWQAQLGREVHASLNAAILRRLGALRAQAGAPAAAGQGWQSPVVLHRYEELAPLVAAVQRMARGVLSFLRIGLSELEMTGCWANVNAPGAAHRVHAHPNNFLSGIYYVQVQPGADTVNFHDPRPQNSVIRPPVTELTGENTDQVVVRVAAGTLLLFPAWLPHSVDANASGRERVSVSFNLMFPALSETLAAPLWGEDGKGA